MAEAWRKWLLPVVVVLATTVLAAGCGPALGTIAGNVTLDGQPLDKGVISYVPADSLGSPATANIVNGKYEIQAIAGNKFVQISAPFVIGTRKEYEGADAPLVEITEERLAAKYNSQTELTFEVKPGANAKDWAVESLSQKQRR